MLIFRFCQSAVLIVGKNLIAFIMIIGSDDPSQLIVAVLCKPVSGTVYLRDQPGSIPFISADQAIVPLFFDNIPFRIPFKPVGFSYFIRNRNEFLLAVLILFDFSASPSP